MPFWAYGRDASTGQTRERLYLETDDDQEARTRASRLGMTVEELVWCGDKNSTAASRKLRSETPCPICGATNYSWGKAGVTAGDVVRFIADDATLWTHLSQFGGEPCRARLCHECGIVQQFAR